VSGGRSVVISTSFDTLLCSVQGGRPRKRWERIHDPQRFSPAKAEIPLSEHSSLALAKPGIVRQNAMDVVASAIRTRVLALRRLGHGLLRRGLTARLPNLECSWCALGPDSRLRSVSPWSLVFNSPCQDAGSRPRAPGGAAGFASVIPHRRDARARVERSWRVVRNAAYFCPAASTIRPAIASGCDIRDTWLALTSIVLAPMRLAMKRCRSGLIVRSSMDTA
jgi:hypothetical protein